jgi:thiamine pyrophosphate-dependent acetolactate synthase large subunit-like protein
MSPSNKARKKPVLDRRAAAAAILAKRGDALVVTGLGAPTWDAAAVTDCHLNFYTWGGMGCAAMVGLGMALAQPQRRVIVITGDGEMLMALGALATIAAQQPRNLSIVVMDNEHYGETGMQVTHTALGTDMAGMAKAAGFGETATIWTSAELKTWLPKIHSAGPLFVDIKVTTERAPLVLPPRDGSLLKLRFRKALLGVES